MLGTDYTGQNCSIARALEIVGERWTLLIVRELLLKSRRFSDLERRLAVSKNILTNRLDKLVQLGVVEGIAYEEARDWRRYTLTEKGRALFPVINALLNWGDVYDAPNGAPAIVEHSCGGPAGHRLVCETCGEPVDALNVHVNPGPGWRSSDGSERPTRDGRGADRIKG